MTVTAWTTFFAVLAVAAGLAAAGLVALRVLSASSPAVAAAWGRVRAEVAPAALPLAAVVAAVATAGSLYYSEVAGFEPCRLCWYQRVAMYPLPVVLGIAAWRRDPAVRWYALPLAGIGAGIAAYHWLLQRFPGLDAGACSAGVPCSAAWVERFGFVTIPWMALSGFVLIAALLWLSADSGRAPGIEAERPYAQAGG